MSRLIGVVLLSLTVWGPALVSGEPGVGSYRTGDGVKDEPKDSAEANARLRAEEQDHSRIMRTLHVLTDIYGPRLTGTPSLKSAGEWAIKEMQSWGFENAHLEGWDFAHPGWTNDRLSVLLLDPS